MTSFEGNAAADGGVSLPARGRGDTISRRVSKLMLVALAYMLLISLSGVGALLFATHKVDRLAKGVGPAADSLHVALTEMLDAETGLRGYIATGQVTFLEPYHASAGRINGTFDTALGALGAVKDHRYDEGIAQARQKALLWLSEWARPIASLSPAAARSVSAARIQAGKTSFDQFRTANGAVLAALERDRAQLRKQVNLFRTVSLLSLLSASCVLIAVALLLSLRTVRGISGPIARLDATVRRLQAGDLSARAELTGPAEVRNLAHALNGLAERAQREALAEDDAAVLAGRVRGLTVAIRRMTGTDRIASIVTKDLGAAFDADRVWLHTFDDPRVTKLSMQWQRPGLSGLPVTFEDAVERSRANVEHMWRLGRPVVVDDHHGNERSGMDSPAFRAATELGVTASMSLPLGDATSVFGLMMVGMTDHPRSWTTAETSTAQAFAAELSHMLLVASTIARQQETVDRLQKLEDDVGHPAGVTPGQMQRLIEAFERHEMDLAARSATGIPEAGEAATLDELYHAIAELTQLLDDDHD